MSCEPCVNAMRQWKTLEELAQALHLVSNLSEHFRGSEDCILCHHSQVLAKVQNIAARFQDILDEMSNGTPKFCCCSM